MTDFSGIFWKFLNEIVPMAAWQIILGSKSGTMQTVPTVHHAAPLPALMCVTLSCQTYNAADF